MTRLTTKDSLWYAEESDEILFIVVIEHAGTIGLLRIAAPSEEIARIKTVSFGEIVFITTVANFVSGQFMNI